MNTLSNSYPTSYPSHSFFLSALVKYLLEREASCNVINNTVSRVTPLHEAVQTRNLPSVRRLCEGGATLHIQDRHGDTPLHYACRTNSVAIIDCLLSVEHHENSIGLTPLFQMVSRRDLRGRLASWHLLRRQKNGALLRSRGGMLSAAGERVRLCVCICVCMCGILNYNSLIQPMASTNRSLHL